LGPGVVARYAIVLCVGLLLGAAADEFYVDMSAFFHARLMRGIIGCLEYDGWGRPARNCGLKP
jgi:hypothetical protein